MFEDEYLQGVDTVVWLVANRDLARPAFPPFHPYRQRRAPKQVTVKAKVIEGLPDSFHEIGAKAKSLPYADAVGSFRFSSDQSESATFVGVGPLILNRRPQGLAEVELHNLIMLKMVPVETWYRDHPDDAELCRYNQIMDLESPEFWILEWTKL